MAATRTSTRQAAQKAKEAIAAAPDVKSRGPAGAKRKETSDKGPAPKKGKKEDDKVKPEENQQPTTEEEVKTTEGMVYRQSMAIRADEIRTCGRAGKARVEV